ncbi:MAG TPA: glutamate--cysteine ligase [Bdellovibrionota bacterium]|nr:glutamate--cysteine ligase [Bdellovibrionota bacterium]
MPPQTRQVLASAIEAKRKEARRWFRERAAEAPLPFYTSIDLRDAGFKIAPVDSNLYPAGFNNLCAKDRRTAGKVFKARIDKFYPGTRRIAVIPEGNTRNAAYAENLHRLIEIFRSGGYEVEPGWWQSSGQTLPLPTHQNPLVLQTVSGAEVRMAGVTISGGKLRMGDFEPDLVVLNRDFSEGHPRELDGLSQPVLPPHQLGWHSRRKSRHFEHYNELASSFAQVLGVDPWFLTVDTQTVEPVNFNEAEGLDRVAEAVSGILSRTADAYKRNGIDRAPFAFLKNNAGTYGMGIHVVKSAEEVLALNRREKNKMSVGKSRTDIRSVVVQEGIPTSILVDDRPGEPVIYLAGCETIGGFLRSNTERGAEENLNSQGMVFKTLCMSDLQSLSDPDSTRDADEKEPELELVYGTVARLSALALGREQAEVPGLNLPKGDVCCGCDD